MANPANAVVTACLPSLRPILSLMLTGSPSPSSSSSSSKQSLRPRSWKSSQPSTSYSSSTSSTSNAGNEHDTRRAYATSTPRASEKSSRSHPSSSTTISQNLTVEQTQPTKTGPVSSFSRLFGEKHGAAKTSSHPVGDVEARGQVDAANWISVEDNIRIEWSTPEKK